MTWQQVKRTRVSNAPEYVEHCGIVYDDIDNIGWLVVDLPLWKLLVCWDGDIPNVWKITIMFQTTTQYVWIRFIIIHQPSSRFFHRASYPNPTIGPMAQVTNKPRHLGSQMSAGLDVLIHEAVSLWGVPSGKHTKKTIEHGHSSNEFSH